MPPVNELVRFALVALYPRVDDLPGLGEMDVDGKIAALRRESTLLFWIGLVGAAFVFQITPILTVRRPWPAVWLDEEQLDAHAHRIATHPVYLLRQTIFLLKLIAGVFWGQAPEVRAFLSLPAYESDPGTRQLGKAVPRPRPDEARERAPVPSLVQLGRREEGLGRGPAFHLDHAIGKEAR